MLAKLLVVLALISIGNVLADDGLSNSISGDDDDAMIAPEEVNGDDEKAEVKDSVIDDQEDEMAAPEEEANGTEQKNNSQEKKNDFNKDNTSDTSSIDDSEWDCIAYSDTIVKCTSKTILAAFEKKAPSSGAGIPNHPPKGVAEPQKDVHIKGPLQEWFDEFFGTISKIHDKIKESIQLPFKTILGK